MRTRNITKVDFNFEKGSVTWTRNYNSNEKLPHTEKPFKWRVYINSNKSILTNAAPNETQAKRLLKTYGNL